MKWVCWIEPGEKLPPPNKKESVSAAHDNLRADADWVPCEHGGFLYLWGEKPHDQDPRDCIFEVAGVSEERHAIVNSSVAAVGGSADLRGKYKTLCQLEMSSWLRCFGQTPRGMFLR